MSVPRERHRANVPFVVLGPGLGPALGPGSDQAVDASGEWDPAASSSLRSSPTTAVVEISCRPSPSTTHGPNPPPAGTAPRHLARAHRPRRGRFVLGAVVLWLIFSASAIALVLNPSPAPETTAAGPILIVGDSLVVQATNALRSWNVPSVPIIADGGSGSAPCDWDNGYTDPYTGRSLEVLQPGADDQTRCRGLRVHGQSRPGVVRRGVRRRVGEVHLVRPSRELPARALSHMARDASAHGARVYFSASPPRNPITPAGAYTGADKTLEYGFNGVPALQRSVRVARRFCARSRPHWTFDPYAAQYVSTSGLTWQLTEKCLPWDASLCLNGNVPVRAGGLDAIHLDDEGAGEALYAIGLMRMPLEQMKGFTPPSSFSVGT